MHFILCRVNVLKSASLCFYFSLLHPCGCFGCFTGFMVLFSFLWPPLSNRFRLTKLFYSIVVSCNCQAVLWSSFKLISVIQLCPLPHSRQLHYYTLFHPSCQPVFESFFISFWSCCIDLQFAVIRGSGPILRAFKKEPGINWFQVPYYNVALTICFLRPLFLVFSIY